MKYFPTLLALAVAATLSANALADETKKPACCAGKAAAGKTAHDCAAGAAGKARAASCDHGSKAEVTLMGKLAMPKDGTGSPVLQAQGRDALDICPESKDLAALRAAGDGSTVEVVGHLCKAKSGKEMITVTSFKKVEKKAAI